MNLMQAEILHRTAHALAAAMHGSKADIVEGAARELNLSTKRTYALLRAVPVTVPERKRRLDANSTAISDAELELIAGVLSTGRRANGKEMWSLERAIDVLHAGGKLATRLSPSRVSTLLRQRFMHPDQLRELSAAVRMRSEHPNSVWQIDASVCVLYRTPKGELLLMEQEAFNKNKLHNVARVMHDLVVRYVGVDHCSGAVGVRLYIGGETTKNALDFLMWLMTQRTAPTKQGLPFYGVPFTLYTDQGSAFKSGAFVNFCKAMSVTLLHHSPRNARATGSVEGSQNIVERGFEGTLRYLDAATLTMDRLHHVADQWINWFNGTEKHSRHGMTRYGAWSLITSEQLRIAPCMELLMAMPTSEPVRRRVSNDMLVSFSVKGFGSFDYDVRNVPGCAPAEHVLVAVNPLAAPSVNVGTGDLATGELTWHTVAPVAYDRFGFDVEAPRLGQEYRAMPLTVVDVNRNRIARQAYATEDGPATLEEADKARRNKVAPYLGQFNPLADLEAAPVPSYLPRRGTAIEVEHRVIEAQVLSAAEVCQRALGVMGSKYPREMYAWVQARFPNGTPEDQLDSVFAHFGWQGSAGAAQLTGTDSSTTTGGLRVVGGNS